MWCYIQIHGALCFDLTHLKRCNDGLFIYMSIIFFLLPPKKNPGAMSLPWSTITGNLSKKKHRMTSQITYKGFSTRSLTIGKHSCCVKMDISLWQAAYLNSRYHYIPPLPGYSVHYCYYLYNTTLLKHQTTYFIRLLILFAYKISLSLPYNAWSRLDH